MYYIICRFVNKNFNSLKYLFILNIRRTTLTVATSALVMHQQCFWKGGISPAFMTVFNVFHYIGLIYDSDLMVIDKV